MPKRTHKIESPQRKREDEIDQEIRRAEYVIRFHTKLPYIPPPGPRMLPSDIDDILEGLDRLDRW